MINKRILIKILIVWAAIIAIYGISRVYKLEWNVTTSLPQKLWISHVGDKKLKVGDYVVFRFHDFRMKKPGDFEYVVKQVGGVGGDQIIVRDWNGNAEDASIEGVPPPNKTSLIYILPDGSYPTFDTLSGNHFTPLTRENLTIPSGCYFVHGQHHPSFDSRYKEFGLVCESQIYGKSYPIF